MNARQKAKRFKRLYEELSKQPLPVIFKEPHHIDTLRYEKIYTRVDALNVTQEIIANDIKLGLAKGLNKYIYCQIDYIPETDLYRICGELKVVDR